MRNNNIASRKLFRTQGTQGWWSIRKAGFGKRMAVLSLVVVSTTLYTVFVNPLMKVLWLFVFLFATELSAYIYTPMYVNNMWLRLTYRKKTVPMTDLTIVIPQQITDLVKRVDAKVDEFRIQPNLRNAYVIGKTVVIGLPLLTELEPQEVLAIIAHELGHVKQKASMVRALVMVGGFLSIWSWFALPIQMFTIASWAYLMILMIPVNWWLESRADNVAREFVGAASLCSALLEIADKEHLNVNEPSEDHQSISDRLKLLRKPVSKRKFLWANT